MGMASFDAKVGPQSHEQFALPTWGHSSLTVWVGSFRRLAVHGSGTQGQQVRSWSYAKLNWNILLNGAGSLAQNFDLVPTDVPHM